MNLLKRLSIRNLYCKPIAVKLNRAIVSFSFDDIPFTAFHHGASILEAYGVTGTFFIAAGLLGKEGPSGNHVTQVELKALKEKNHHIGCHTYSHVRISDLNSNSQIQEVHQNKTEINKLLPNIELSHFSFPFGDVSVSAKNNLSQYYKTMRSTEPGINVNKVDLNLLNSVALYDCRLSRQKIDWWIEQVKTKNGWLIFYTHDVQDKPSDWGVSINSFRYTIEKALSSDISILNIENAYNLILNDEAKAS